MNHERLGAEFGTMTEEEQGSVTGGDSGFVKAVAWFVGYTLTAFDQAIILTTKLTNRQPAYFFNGHGWT